MDPFSPCLPFLPCFPCYPFNFLNSFPFHSYHLHFPFHSYFPFHPFDYFAFNPCPFLLPFHLPFLLTSPCHPYFPKAWVRIQYFIMEVVAIMVMPLQMGLMTNPLVVKTFDWL